MSSKQRFFPNPFMDEFEGEAAAALEASPFAEQAQTRAAEILTKKILPHYSGGHGVNDEDIGTVYIGTAGAAYLLIEREILGITQSAENLETALALLHKAKAQVHKKRQASFLEGHAGLIALSAVASFRAGKGDEAAMHAETLCALWETSVSKMAKSECEVLYGRAGYLYALLYVHKHLGGTHIPLATVQAVVGAILAEGISNGKRYGPYHLTYFWHDTLYLGGAHGVSGILLMLLQARDMFPEALQAPELALVLAAVDDLLLERAGNGNLPAAAGSRSHDMVQWCHGAPGLVSLLAAAIRHADASRLKGYQTALADAAEVVWQQGLLRKGVGICHGIGGNGLTLLSAYRATKDAKHLSRARLFASFGMAHFAKLEYVPDHPFSLFEGMGGFVALLDGLAAPEAALYPCFELL